MFNLVLTTCFAGILCYASEPEVPYVTAARCLEQGAIISGLARANLGLSRLDQTSKIVCAAPDGTTETMVLGTHDPAVADFPLDTSSLPRID